MISEIFSSYILLVAIYSDNVTGVKPGKFA